MNKLNIEHTLFPFQERDMNKVVEEFKNHDRICLVASTGYGKTYSFCTIAKWYKHNYNKKVLILCHRIELVEQTIKTLINIGLTAEKVTPDKKKYHHTADVYVAMEMTVYNKKKKNPRFLNNVGLIIIDECHIQFGVKHLELIKDEKVLGFTATPIINKRETYYKCEICEEEYNENTICHNHETIEWGRPITMSRYYDTVITGTNISELIDYGQIVQEINFSVDVDLSNLKTDSSGDYTTKSLNETFNNEKVIHDVVANYENISLGKRTMVFTSSTSNNVKVLESFLEKGYNARLFDSVNDSDLSRKEVVKWFESNSDAILINASIFTTGFDSTDVECIILNRATTSLSLYIQMVGRGARSSKKIYKDSFIVIDLGGNIKRFGTWSDPTRDWEKIFYNGIGADKAKKESILDVKECKSCGYLMPRSVNECPECGYITQPKEKNIKQSDDIAKPLDNIPYPNGEKIYKYTISRGENIHFAHKILINQIFDMFRFYQVSKEIYENTKRNGKLDAKLNQIVRKVYFVLMRKEDLEGTNRTIQEIINRIKRKLDKYYV